MSMVRTGDQPRKLFAGCGRPFSYRKTRESVWGEVRFRRERCRREAWMLQRRVPS